jgi:hypothetical protein
VLNNIRNLSPLLSNVNRTTIGSAGSPHLNEAIKAMKEPNLMDPILEEETKDRSPSCLKIDATAPSFKKQTSNNIPSDAKNKNVKASNLKRIGGLEWDAL